MKTFTKYIEDFLASDNIKRELGSYLDQERQHWANITQENLHNSLDKLIECYNFLGQKENKNQYQVDQNLARNLPGAMMQDWLIELCKSVSTDYPKILIFTEVKVPFGKYPLWDKGSIEFGSPSERSDIALGYLLREDQLVDEFSSNFDLPIQKLEKGESVLPIITVNSKIRVSQGEFFDWLGRETLMTKGNPHCFSIQVCLRKEMDLDIVEVAQAEDKWFLLGSGGESNVTPDYKQVDRLYASISNHLKRRLGDGS